MAALPLLEGAGVGVAVGPGQLEEALDGRHEHGQVRGRSPVEGDALIEEAGHEALLALVDGVPVEVGALHEVVGLPHVLFAREGLVHERDREAPPVVLVHPVLGVGENMDAIAAVVAVGLLLEDLVLLAAVHLCFEPLLRPRLRHVLPSQPTVPGGTPRIWRTRMTIAGWDSRPRTRTRRPARSVSSFLPPFSHRAGNLCHKGIPRITGSVFMSSATVTWGFVSGALERTSTVPLEPTTTSTHSSRSVMSSRTVLFDSAFTGFAFHGASSSFSFSTVWRIRAVPLGFSPSSTSVGRSGIPEL